jgi:hypothetical protein
MLRTAAWIFVFTFLALAGCASGPAPSPNTGLIISDLKIGLLRRTGVNWEVYEHGSDFLYKSNGICKANGVETPCMWWGFTFDYRTPAGGAELLCSVRLSRPQNMVSPRGEYGASMGGEYRIRLTGNGTHRSVNFQNTKNELPGKLSMRTVCTYEDKAVFDFEWAVTFSESDVAAPGDDGA